MERRAQGLAAVAAVAVAAVAAGSATARLTAGLPENVTLPQVSGLSVGQTLTATPGTWKSDSPLSTFVQWVRITPNGERMPLAGQTHTAYTVTADDVGSRLQVQVKAQNATGPAWANSDGTAVVVGPAVTRLASGVVSVSAADVAPPNRLVVSAATFAPTALAPGHSGTVRITVTDTLSHRVANAIVRAVAVPFDGMAPIVTARTGADGTAVLTLQATARLPRTGGAALSVVATKDGDQPLAGVSGSRLFRLPVAR